MPKSRPPYPPEYRRKIVALVRASRNPNELAQEFECRNYRGAIPGFNAIPSRCVGKHGQQFLTSHEIYPSRAPSSRPVSSRSSRRSVLTDRCSNVSSRTLCGAERPLITTRALSAVKYRCTTRASILSRVRRINRLCRSFLIRLLTVD